jgi:carbon-monoxide dehydrogenase large subunit
MYSPGAQKPWVGRVEDERLLRGQGRFSDDLREPNMLFACFVRSPYAFAKIIEIDITQAKAMSGVRAVFTGTDLASSGRYESVTIPYPLAGCESITVPYRPVLATDRVMHVGEAVAVVVADSWGQAQDAADRVAIEYEPLKPASGIDRNSPTKDSQLWPEAHENTALEYSAPADADGHNATEIERCFAQAAHVASINLKNQRLAAVSMETRVATALYDPADDLLTLRCGSQGVAGIQREICRTMRLTPERIRVVTRDVGGGFGMKASPYPEYIALLHAAKLLERPVHWASTRSEAFQTDNQARDSEWSGALALDKEGRFLALRINVTANIGAYLTGVGHFCATRHVAECLPGMYDIPYVSLHTRCIFTNSAPIGPYRGAGRPETNYFLERLIDSASRRVGMDPAKLRRINLLTPDRLPFATKLGNVYDGGDFPAVLDKALIAADYANFPTRRKKSQAKGLLRGLGIGCYLENSGAFPEESARITFENEGISVSIGAGSTGQGHETVFRLLVAERLGVSPEIVTISYGDSSKDVPGFGAVASRTAMMVGGAIAKTIDAVIVKGAEVAALLLQCQVSEVEYGQGYFQLKSGGQALKLLDVAARAQELARQSIVRDSLDTTATVKAPASFPNGCHIAEVEIERETGRLEIVSYIGVDDCGTVLNPIIVQGQFHGGVVQGIGQALREAVIYDNAGQLVSGSFMDYGVPRAADIPFMKVLHHEVVCKTNPLGVKGAGESGTTAAPCAVVNAIANALPSEQAALLNMPVTPEQIWQALRS